MNIGNLEIYRTVPWRVQLLGRSGWTDYVVFPEYLSEDTGKLNNRIQITETGIQISM